MCLDILGYGMQMNKEQFKNKVFDFFLFRKSYSKKNISVSSIFLLNSFASKTEFAIQAIKTHKKLTLTFLEITPYKPPPFF